MGTPATVSLPSATSRRILAVGERLAQTRGFNGFSYADIATTLRITKASLHYHFATKASLGRALIARYAERFGAALARIEADPGADAKDRVSMYVELFESVLVRDRMCLCGMFAAEYATLPTGMRRELRRFFDANEAWLARDLERGRTAGALRFEGSPLEAARTVTAGLEGAMLLARTHEDPNRFAQIARRLLMGLGVSSTGSRPRRGSSSER